MNGPCCLFAVGGAGSARSAARWVGWDPIPVLGHEMQRCMHLYVHPSLWST
jgi:hypothetical protein